MHRRDPLHITDPCDFENDFFCFFATHGGEVCTGHMAQTALSDATSCSISESSWNGDGVMRSLSVPFGTVG